MPGHFKQVRSLSWVGHQYTPQEIARMGRHIFGERQRSRDNVLVQEINVITIRVGGVIVKGEVSRKHRVLMPHVSSQFNP